MLLPLGLLILSAAAWMITWRTIDRHFRLPLLLYGGAYGITTLIGATLVGIYGIPLLDSLDFGLDTGPLHDLDSITYWGILFAPMVFVPLCSLLFISMLVTRPKSDGRARQPQ